MLANLTGLRRGQLGICASQTMAGYRLRERRVRFHERYPATELDVAVGNTREVAEAVLDGSCELGFVEGEVDHPLLDQTEVGQDRLVILVHLRMAGPDGMRCGSASLRGPVGDAGSEVEHPVRFGSRLRHGGVRSNRAAGGG